VLKDDVISQFTFDDFLKFYHKLCGRRDVHNVFNRLYVIRSFIHPVVGGIAQW